MLEKLYEDCTLLDVFSFPPIDIPVSENEDELIQEIEENIKKMDELEKIKGIEIINNKNIEREKVLVHACIKGRKDLVISMLDKGVKLNSREGMYAFFYACVGGWKDIVNLFIEKDIQVSMKNCMATLIHLCDRKDADVDIVRYLLGEGLNINTKLGASAFFRACRNGRKDIIQVFFEYGFDFNSNYGANILILVCKQKDANLDIVKYLLSKELNINNVCGERAFFYAYHNGRKDILELLISNGLNIKNEDGANIFLDACRWADIDVVKLLLDNGLGINNEYGGLAFANACINRDQNIVKLLFDKGIRIEVAFFEFSNKNKIFFDETLCRYLKDSMSEMKRIDCDRKNVRFDASLEDIKKVQQRVWELVEYISKNGIKLGRFNKDAKVFLDDISKIAVKLKHFLIMGGGLKSRKRPKECDYENNKYIKLGPIELKANGNKVRTTQKQK